MRNPMWTEHLPIWVSRETSDGFISQLMVPGWLFMTIGILALVNFLVWSLISLVVAVKVVF